MNSYRNILITALLTLGTFGIVLYTSCKSKCGSTTCQNGGTCSSNKCICPTGYSGNSCQTGWSDIFIGTYNCSRSDCSLATAGATKWVSAITKNANNSGFTVNISNFDNSNSTVAAIIDSFHKITISPTTGAYGVEANGIDSAGKITMTFTTSTPSGSGGYTCKMTMVKQ